MGSIWICIQTIRISCICLPKRSYISDNGGGGWLELLNDYDMSVIDHPCKANVVANALSHMTMGSVSHVEEVNKDLVKDVHKLDHLGAMLEDSPNGGCVVYHKSESSLVVEVKSKQHLDPLSMELKESVLSNLMSHSR